MQAAVESAVDATLAAAKRFYGIGNGDDSNTSRRRQTPFLVAIGGPPGSGKSTIAVALRNEIMKKVARRRERNQPQKEEEKEAEKQKGENQKYENLMNHISSCVVMPMDGYHYPKAVLRTWTNAEQAFERRGAPWTFDAALLTSDLRHLLRTGSLDAPGFDHSVGDPEPGAIRIRCGGSDGDDTDSVGFDSNKSSRVRQDLQMEATKESGDSSDRVNNNRGDRVGDGGGTIVFIEGLYMGYSPPSPPSSCEDPENDQQNATSISIDDGEREDSHSYNDRDWAVIAALIPFHIFIDIPLDVSTERVIQRHMAAWGISREEATHRATGSDYTNAKLVVADFERRRHSYFQCLGEEPKKKVCDDVDQEMETVAPIHLHHVIDSVDDRDFVTSMLSTTADTEP